MRFPLPLRPAGIFEKIIAFAWLMLPVEIILVFYFFDLHTPNVIEDIAVTFVLFICDKLSSILQGSILLFIAGKIVHLFSRYFLSRLSGKNLSNNLGSGPLGSALFAIVVFLLTSALKMPFLFLICALAAFYYHWVFHLKIRGLFDPSAKRFYPFYFWFVLPVSVIALSQPAVIIYLLIAGKPRMNGLSNLFGDVWVGGGFVIVFIWLSILALMLQRISTKAGQRSEGMIKNILLLLCSFALPLSIFGFKATPLSTQAHVLFESQSSYFIFVDDDNRRAYLTESEGKIHLFNLDDLSLPPVSIHVITNRMEDFVYDKKQNRILFLQSDPSGPENDTSKQLVELKADTLQVKSSDTITFCCQCKDYKHAFLASLNRLYVVCEDERYLYSIDTEKNLVVNRRPVGLQTSIIEDSRYNVLYANYEFKTLLETLDAHTLETLYRTEGPIRSETMHISQKDHLLYVAVPRYSEIQIFSIPELKLQDRVKTVFGVRCFAVDEENRILVAGSYLTGMYLVIDLDTKQIISKHFLGKYGRVLDLDPQTRRAFLTIDGIGLITIQY